MTSKTVSGLSLQELDTIARCVSIRANRVQFSLGRATFYFGALA